jgi:acetolactate synthase-1/2/3 large subunit
MIKVSDYISNFISKLGVKHVFTVSGAGDLHLIDSIRKHSDLDFICNHHEQASAMAAYSYSRATKNFGVCVVTTGPGATNAITGMIDCWVDSVPCLYISGQVQKKYQIGKLGIRQNGIQEINIIDMVRPVTKYANCIDDPQQIRWHLEKAVYEAKSGRPGPSWLDIPMDIQTSIVNEDELVGFVAEKIQPKEISETTINEIFRLIENSERPILLLGHGVKASASENLIPELLDILNFPVCVGWNAIDLVESEHPMYVGRFGTYGQRAANFAIQNSDLLISIGSRLNITQTGYVYEEFAREAKKIYIDIDINELNKFPIQPEFALNLDAKYFITELLKKLKSTKIDKKESERKKWVLKIKNWIKKYPVALPEYKKEEKYLNSFTLIDILTNEINENDVIIPTASGSGFTSFHQVANIKRGQTIYTSNGFAEMGFDIPGAIGAAVATGKNVWQTTGDGGVQMNIQELQTLVHYKLPVKIFIHNNQGYLTIRHTQNSLFDGNFTASSYESGVSLPSFEKLAKAYGIPFFKLSSHKKARNTIKKMQAISGPCICEVIMDPAQQLIPKTSFKILPDGKLVSPPIEDLFPFLERKEFLSNMIIKPIN